MDAGTPRSDAPGRGGRRCAGCSAGYADSCSRVRLGAAVPGLPDVGRGLHPGFRAPDELQHVNSVVRMAEGGGWPRPGDTRVRNEVLEALRLSGAVLDAPGRTFRGRARSRRERRGSPTSRHPRGRGSFHAMDDGSAPSGPIDQMTQHPPAYYAFASLVYRAVGAGDLAIDRAVFLLRALTALMVALTSVLFCRRTGTDRARNGRQGRRLRAAPDTAVPVQQRCRDQRRRHHRRGLGGLGAVARDHLSGPTRRRLLFLAVAVAAACWTRGTALSLLPAVPVAIAIAYRRSLGGRLVNWARPALGAMVGTLGLAFVLGGWWWALNLVRYGHLQPAAYEIPPGRMAPLGILDFLNMFAWRVRWNFFAEVAILRSPALYPLAMSLAALFAVMVTAGLLTRRGLADRLMLLVGMGATLGVLIATTYFAHVHSGLPGHPGSLPVRPHRADRRLLRRGPGPLAALVRIRARWVVPAIALAGLGVTLLGLALGFRGDYVVTGRSWGEGIDRFFGWAAWSPTVIVGLVGTFVLCGFALAWVLGRQAHHGGSVGVATLPSSGRVPIGEAAPPRPPAAGGIHGLANTGARWSDRRASPFPPPTHRAVLHRRATPVVSPERGDPRSVGGIWRAGSRKPRDTRNLFPASSLLVSRARCGRPDRGLRVTPQTAGARRCDGAGDRRCSRSGGQAVVGVAVEVEGLTKSFGSQNIWSDVTLTLPPGEISVLLGPSGTGKSVFLKSLVGLLKPERGSIVIDGHRPGPDCSERELYEIRKLFGVLFQDGALFGSMTLFDNIAFPLREHTKKSESEIKQHRAREDGHGRPARRRTQAAR